MWKYVVLVFCTFAILVQCEDVPGFRDVQIVQGTVRGHLDPDNDLYVFYDIPYATAPTGPDRFKAPRPPPVFLTTFDAIDRGIICPQPDASNMEMREDCLVVNLFVPQTATKDTKLPVLVIVHGGAYQFGSGSHEKFRELANTKSKPVIVVTFNYRLGVHGFLCLGTEDVPGNAGLKDQVELLRWVNTNIASFGGNPEDVTLAACSAGSGSVDFLTLSSTTEGLFNKAIMESGVSTGAVGAQIDPIENAKYYAKLLDFSDVDDLKKLEEFYKTASFQTLLSRREAITSNQDSAIYFAPCVETDISQERVVFNAPFNILQEGNYTKIPLMYGFTNMDGQMRASVFESWSAQMNAKFSDFLPAELHFDSKDKKEEVAQMVKRHYFGNEAVSEANAQNYITYFTDVLFGYPMLRSLSTRIEALGDTIFLFEYSFVDENTPPAFPGTDIKGAYHCAQTTLVMDEDVTDKTTDYKRVKTAVRTFWHNFILTGSPTSDTDDLKWQHASAERSPYMSLGSEIKMKDIKILGERAAFWDAIYKEHYRGPVTTETTTTATTPSTTETTSTETTSTETTTTVLTTTPGDGAVSIVSSNVMFLLVSLSFYLTFYNLD